MITTLLIGCGVLLGSMVAFGVAAALIVNLMVSLEHRAYMEGHFWRNVLVMLVVTLIMTGSHLLQIAVWAVVLQLCGQVADFETAFYLAAENYTALGYGDIVLSGSWRLFGPLEAINGLLLFGMSTALMFAVMSRMVAHRTRGQWGLPGAPK